MIVQASLGSAEIISRSKEANEILDFDVMRSSYAHDGYLLSFARQ